MAKVHELLAVEQNLKGQAEKNRMDLQNTFEKKRTHFSEKRVTFTPNTEGAEAVTTEQSAIQTTVRDEVQWLSGFIAKSIDAGYQIDLANTLAKADVILEDGEEPILNDVPATALLQLAKRVKELQEFIQTIPTLDPVKGFLPDLTRGNGYYIARDVVKDRTEKQKEFQVVVQATDKFPAQVQEVIRDAKVGVLREQEWSSLITPAMKAQLLERVETLLRAVTKARARANDQDFDAKSNKIGAKLLDYVFQPLVS